MPIKDVNYTVKGAATYSEMTAPDIAAALKETNVILIPVASTEQAGPHLPTMTDQIFSVEMCRRTVAALRERGRTLVLGPTVPFGDAGPHSRYPAGMVNIQPTTLVTLLRDICDSLIAQGFRNIIFLEAHGGNNAAMELAARIITNDTEAQVVVMHPKASYKGFAGILKSTVVEGSYGESVTSRVLATYPTLVDRSAMKIMKEAKKTPSFPGINWPVKDYRDLEPEGGTGDPTIATAETGNALFEVIVAYMVETIEAMFDADMQLGKK